MARRSVPPPAGAGDDAEPYGLLSGIADPARFEAAARRIRGRDPAIIGRFDDHAPYDAPMLEDLWRRSREAGVRRWLTTAKDRIKLARIWPPDLELVEIGLQVDWAPGSGLADLVVERMKRGDDD